MQALTPVEVPGTARGRVPASGVNPEREPQRVVVIMGVV
jgi:hypothetical protein